MEEEDSYPQGWCLVMGPGRRTEIPNMFHLNVSEIWVCRCVWEWCFHPPGSLIEIRKSCDNINKP